MESKASDILHFQVKRDVVNLYKRYLSLIEDLRNEHRRMVEKLEAELPREYHSVLRSSDYFDDSKFAYLRKRVLDTGNESVRGIEDQLKQFDVEFGGAR